MLRERGVAVVETGRENTSAGQQCFGEEWGGWDLSPRIATGLSRGGSQTHSSVLSKRQHTAGVSVEAAAVGE